MRRKIIFLSLLGIALWACEEDIYEVQNPETNRFGVAHAKIWYEANAPLVKPNGILTKSVNDNDPTEILNLQPLLDWDIAELSNDSVWDVVELPWEYENVEEIFALSEVWEYAGANNLMPGQVIKLVVIRHRQTGNIYGFKMKIAPDLDYMLDMGEDLKTNKYLVRDSDLSGIVMFCTLDDRFINGWQYRDGVVYGKLVPANMEGTETPAAVSGTRSADWHIELDEVIIIGGLKHANLHTQESGYLVFPPDDRERPGQVDIQEPLDLSGGSGSENNNGSGGDSEEIIFLPVPKDSIINSHTLSVLQLMKLDLALKELIEEGCMQKALYEALISKNVKLDFGMLPTAVNPANYNPYNKSIKFRDNNSINKESIKEELFHAWQDAYYPGGTGQYGKDAQGNKLPGYVNVEFEAKFYRDIIEHPDGLCCNAFGENLPDNLYQEYYNWIESIRFSENLSFSNSDYRKWLNYFQQYDKNYTSPISDNLSTPKALRDLMNNATCF